MKGLAMRMIVFLMGVSFFSCTINRELLDTDSEAPLVQIIGLSQNQHINSPMIVNGTAYDSSAIQFVSITVVKEDTAQTNVLPTTFSGIKFVRFTNAVVLTAYGNYSVWVSVSDAHSNIGKSSVYRVVYTQNSTSSSSSTDTSSSAVSSANSSLSGTAVPKIAVLAPQSGTATSESNIMVKGTVLIDSGNINSLKVNGVEAIRNGSVWSEGVDLQEGTNEINILAVSDLAVSKSTNIFVIRDNENPLLTISSHTNGSLVGSDFTLSGSALDALSGIQTVYYKEASDAAYVVANYQNGMWSANISGIGGSVDYTIYAIDMASNTSLTQVVSLVFDSTLPIVNISKPVNGLLTNAGSVLFSGSASVAGLDSINRVELSLNNGSYYDASGTNSWSLTISGLTEGSNFVRVRVISINGRTNTLSPRLVRVDQTPPTANLTLAGTTSFTNQASYTASGISADSSSGVAAAYLGVNGSYSVVTPSTSWTKSVDVSAGGTFVLSTYAVDAAGNASTTNTATLNVIQDQSAPIVSASPVAGNYADAQSVILSATDNRDSSPKIYYTTDGTTPTTASTLYTSAITVDSSLTIKAIGVDDLGNQSGVQTYSYTIGSQDFILHYKKPSAWAGAYIHYWNIDGVTSTTWGANPALTDEGNGWFTYTISNPSNDQSASFLFKNTAGTNSVIQSDDLTKAPGEWWYWTNNTWYASNPEDASSVALTIGIPMSDYAEVGSDSLTASGEALGGGGINAVYVSVNGGADQSATLNGSGWSSLISLNMGTNTLTVWADGVNADSAPITTHIVRVQSDLPVHDTTTYSGKLGANLYANGVEFSVHWRSSVCGGGVSVKIGSQTYPMTFVNGDSRGDVWWTFVQGIPAGSEYQWVSDNGITISDPYAKYNRYSSGKSVVVDQTSYQWGDQSWSRPGWGYYEIYELHVKDFTKADPSVPVAHRGKYLGIADKAAYLTNLGMTAVELMPPSEFPDAGYSWGYNTSLFMSVESGFATDPSSGQYGVDEFKQMVDTLHQQGIAVIVDLVFNHTANNDNWLWQMDSLLYFDYNNDGVVEAGSGGADATPWGNRLVTWRDEVKRLGKDTVAYFMTDLHVDGFRFDATATDYMDHSFIKDLKTYANTLDANVFFVYENLPNDADLKTYGAQWSDSYHDDGVNLFRGDGADLSWMANKIEGDETWANSPYECLNYVESHDEDSLGFHAFDPTYGKGFDEGTAQARSRAMAVMLAGSLGHPMILMGQEFLRNKEGQNTDEAYNTLDWSEHDTRIGLVNYYGGVFRLRRDYDALRTYDGTKLSWIYDPRNESDKQKAAWRLDGTKDVVVMLNLNGGSVDLWLPAGNWIKVVNEGEANTATTWANMVSGGQNVSVGANSGVMFIEQ